MKACVLIALGFLVGCGGSGGGGTPPVIGLPFLAGQWEGGYWRINLSSTGAATGTTISPAEPGGTFSGALTEERDATGQLRVPPGSLRSFEGTWNYETQSGELVLVLNAGGTTEVIELRR